MIGVARVMGKLLTEEQCLQLLEAGKRDKALETIQFALTKLSKTFNRKPTAEEYNDVREKGKGGGEEGTEKALGM